MYNAALHEYYKYMLFTASELRSLYVVLPLKNDKDIRMTPRALVNWPNVVTNKMPPKHIQ